MKGRLDEPILRHVFERLVAGRMVNGLVKGEGFAVDASAMEANASLYRGKAPDELDWTNAQRQKRRWPRTWQHWRPKRDRKTRQNSATATAQIPNAAMSRSVIIPPRRSLWPTGSTPMSRFSISAAASRSVWLGLARQISRVMISLTFIRFSFLRDASSYATARWRGQFRSSPP